MNPVEELIKANFVESNLRQDAILKQLEEINVSLKNINQKLDDGE